MNTAERSELQRVLHARREAIATEWYRAIARTSYIPLSAAQVRQRLVELTEQAIATLVMESFDKDQTQAIGTALARLHYAQPEVLGRTQAVLARRLVEGLPADQVAALQPRLAALLGDLAIGFCQQTRATILTEQERIRGALVSELRATDVALRRAHDVLEARVQERTVELAQTNKDLRREIAERRCAEQQIRVANERLQYLLSSSKAVIYTAKTSGDYAATFVSENATQLVGYEPRRFLEPSFWIDHVHPEDRPRVLTELPRVFERERYAYEYRFQRSDGTYIWMRDEMGLVRDEEDNPLEVIGYWIDVTERRRVEEALRESEENFRALAKNANDGILILTGKGTYVYANQRAAEITGYSIAELLEIKISDLAHPDEVEKLKDRLKKRLAGQPAPYQYEAALIDKGGKTVPVEVTAARTTWHDQVADIVILRDISERKRVEEALRESEEMARALLNAPTDVAALVDAKGFILDANEAMARRFGRPVDELIGVYGWDLIPPDLVERRKAYVNQVIQSGEPCHFEDRSRGTWFDNVFYPVFDAQGKVSKIALLARDITKRKQAEEAIKQRNRELAEEKQKTETILQSIGDGVCTTDPGLLLLSLNPAAERLLGWQGHKAIGRPCSEVLQCHNFDGEPACETMCPLVVAMQERRYEFSRLGALFMHSRRGQRIPIWGVAGPLEDPAGTVLGGVLAFRDASYEAEMERLQREFTSMISHEVRAPLTNLKAAAQTFNRLESRQDDETRVNLARIIVEQCDRLDRLVQRVENVAQFEAGCLDVQIAPLYLPSLVRDVVHLFQMRESHRTFTVITADEPALWVMGDEDKISMVLNNLLDNAAKYSHRQGAITVELSLRDPDQVLISVIDEGPGIPVDQRDRIFQRFYRIDNSDTRSVYGLGLGLYIVQELVTAQDGQVWLDEMADSGNCFCFTLPRAAAQTRNK